VQKAGEFVGDFEDIIYLSEKTLKLSLAIEC